MATITAIKKFCVQASGCSMDPKFVVQVCKNHRIDNNSTTTKAREKLNTDFESFVIIGKKCLTKSKKNHFLLVPLIKLYLYS